MKSELIVPEKSWYTVRFRNDPKYKGMDYYLGTGCKTTTTAIESRRLSKTAAPDWGEGNRVVPSCLPGDVIKVTVPQHVLVIETGD